MLASAHASVLAAGGDVAPYSISTASFKKQPITPVQLVQERLVAHTVSQLVHWSDMWEGPDHQLAAELVRKHAGTLSTLWGILSAPDTPMDTVVRALYQLRLPVLELLTQAGAISVAEPALAVMAARLQQGEPASMRHQRKTVQEIMATVTQNPSTTSGTHQGNQGQQQRQGSMMGSPKGSRKRRDQRQGVRHQLAAASGLKTQRQGRRLTSATQGQEQGQEQASGTKVFQYGNGKCCLEFCKYFILAPCV